MARRDDLLRQAIDGKTDPVFLTNRFSVVEAYRDKYKSDWKSHIVSDILAQNPNLKKASVQREFQYDKRTGQERYKNERVTGATRARYESLGKQLPPIGRKLRGDSITITVKGKQNQYSGKKGNRHKSGTADRTIEVTFSGASAEAFIEEPSYYSIWDEYGVDPDIFDEGEYEIDVYSVG